MIGGTITGDDFVEVHEEDDGFGGGGGEEEALTSEYYP